MIHVLLSLIIGGLVNRYVRGGEVARLTEEWLSGKFKLFEKQIKFVVSADFLNFLIFTVFCLFYFSPVVALLLGAAMWVGAAPSWGQYMEGVSGLKTKPQLFNRNKLFDWLPNKVLKVTNYNYKLAGVTGFTLRGLFWGALLSVVSFSPWPLIIGCTMGLVYYVTYMFKNETFPSFTLAEVVFGALLWCSVVIERVF